MKQIRRTALRVALAFAAVLSLGALATVPAAAATTSSASSVHAVHTLDFIW
jgi:hypothetical protein